MPPKITDEAYARAAVGLSVLHRACVAVLLFGAFGWWFRAKLVSALTSTSYPSLPSRVADIAFPHFRERDRDRLSAVLARAAGIYSAPHTVNSVAGWPSESQSDISAEHTVLVVTFNTGYIDFFENWATRAVEMGLTFMAWPQDETAAEQSVTICERLRPGLGAHVFFSKAATRGTSKRPTEFRKAAFNHISALKFYMVQAILAEGYHAWLSDVDVGFISDPWPVMLTWRAGLNCDYQFQPNGVDYNESVSNCEGNTGFHLIRNTVAGRGLIDAGIAENARVSGLDDQTNFWNVLNRNSRVLVARADDMEYWRDIDLPTIARGFKPPANAAVLCPLPHQLFQTGCYHCKDEEKWVILHANFRVGRDRKQRFLQKHSLWTVQTLSKWPSPTARARVWQTLTRAMGGG